MECETLDSGASTECVKKRVLGTGSLQGDPPPQAGAAEPTGDHRAHLCKMTTAMSTAMLKTVWGVRQPSRDAGVRGADGKLDVDRAGRE